MIGKRLLASVASAALILSAPGPAIAAPAKTATFRQAAPITAKERQQGTAAHPDILQEYGGAQSGPQAAYATRVGQRIAVQSGLAASPQAFTVTLLNSPVENAFAIPGGYVYLPRDLMALMNDEAELAAVLGHEVGHVAARHSKKRQNAATRNTILGAIGQVLVGAVAGDSAIGGLLNKGIGTGTQLITLGYSRGQETQADDLAVQYLVRAGYDPGALATMLRSLAAQETLDQRISGNSRSLPQWASTHPDPAARVQHATAQAAATRATGVRNRDAFLAALDGLMYGDDPKLGVVEGRNFLHPGLRFAFTIPQGFTMQNGANAVSISGPNAQAQFGTGAYQGSLESYIGSVLQGLAGNGGALPRSDIRRTSVNGIPAAYTQIRANSGSTQVDVTVFAYAPSSGQAFHFVMLTPAGQGIGAMESMVESFRTLSASEAAAVKPRFVRVVTVKAGDTPASLSRRMAFTDYPLERFLVLNGLGSGSRLTPGQKVKLVTY
ncbi:MAG: LysM peptidoglycan-binding domain-containing protein [Alphaproteobacteria bacterium]|nr:MAG: LysM peptidoglycan-binding domain-containing protein [Alphaproteobacteria bacterium]